MIRIARTICWLCVALILLGIGALYRHNPNLVGSHTFVQLLPIAITLVAFYLEPNRWIVWSAIVANVIVALLGGVLFVVGALGEIAVPWVGLMMGAFLVGLAGLNTVTLRARLLPREKDEEAYAG
jgi:hypothetical protein